MNKNYNWLIIVGIIVLVMFVSNKKTAGYGCDPGIKICIEGTCYGEEEASALMEQGKQVTNDCTEYTGKNGFMDIINTKYGGIPLYVYLIMVIVVLFLFMKKK